LFSSQIFNKLNNNPVLKKIIFQLNVVFKYYGKILCGISKSLYIKIEVKLPLTYFLLRDQKKVTKKISATKNLPEYILQLL